MVTSVKERLEGTCSPLLAFEFSSGETAFGMDFAGGNVSEINTFYSGHYWPAASLDMNNDEDYALDSSRGE